MPENHTAYTLTKHVQDSFLGKNDNLTPDEIHDSGVVAYTAYETDRAPALYVSSGDIDSRRTHQTLSLGKTGIFCLTTIRIGKDAGSKIEHVRITPRSHPVKMEYITRSLFMHKLVHIALTREEPIAVEPERIV